MVRGSNSLEGDPMSPNEIRDFCAAVKPYQLRVEVRLKLDSTPIIGMIEKVEDERFELATGTDVRSLRYAWVARVKSH